jgi:DNA-binding MarR family transcriptional regulator
VCVVPPYPTSESCAALLTSARTLHGLHRRLLREDSTQCSALRANVLAAVADHGPLRPSALAEHLRIDGSVVSRQLHCLDADGLVERIADPADGRAQLVRVTTPGRDYLDGLRRRASSALAARLDGWSDDDVDTLAELLLRLEHSLTLDHSPIPEHSIVEHRLTAPEKGTTA